MSGKYNPFISVDCVVFGFDGEELNVLLIRRDRKLNDEVERLKLPGSLININEDLDTSADRVLRELTGLTDIYLKNFGVFGNPNRLRNHPDDLRWLIEWSGETIGRVVTIAYYSLIRIDRSRPTPLSLAYQARWIPVSQVPYLIFDHNDILQSALLYIQNELITKPICFELLPEKFTLNSVQKVYESILNLSFDNRNFRKKIKKARFIVPTHEKQTSVRHKPAMLYYFDRAIYESLRKEHLGFVI